VLETQRKEIDDALYTSANLKKMLDDFQTSVANDVKKQMETLGLHGFVGNREAEAEQRLKNLADPLTQYTAYSYDGRFYDAPKTFKSPIGVKRDVGWKLWLNGMPAYQEMQNGQLVNCLIKPFRKLCPAKLPKGLANTYKLHWRPLFQMMELSMHISDASYNLSTDKIDALFARGTDNLKSRVSYIFTRSNFETWTLSTWGEHIQRSYVVKYGTPSDIEKLPEPTRFNRLHRHGRKLKEPVARENTRTGRCIDRQWLVQQQMKNIVQLVRLAASAIATSRTMILDEHSPQWN
jgi:hypothetical protein